jgi:succinylarginine dihydrolase
MPSTAYEVNFDGLVGPTHSYAGLAYGNVASAKHRHSVSNPKAAALQGLAKMKLLADLGLKQAVLPPQERPDTEALRRLGFDGTDAQVLEKAARADPAILAACCSASSMWAANAATVSPSADAADGRVHLTPANLVSQFHRSLEPTTTAAVLRAIFPDPAVFAHHPPLPSALPFGDEGAANHSRFAPAHGMPGVELFVYGRRALDHSGSRPSKYPARQTYEASSAIARLHQLHEPAGVVFPQQNPDAIDAGVFHNDVVAVGNGNVLLCHELAFLDRQHALDELRARYAGRCGGELVVIEATADELPIADAVGSYVFNSQLVTLPDSTMTLVAPVECEEYESVRRFLHRLLASGGPVRAVRLVDVRHSMRNGGGPACLRLRVVLTEAELAKVLPSVLLTDELYADLAAWVARHYRERLEPADLADPKLLTESRDALDELTRILGLGKVYRFQ